MGPRRKTSIDVRKCILRVFKKGKSYREIAKIVDRSHSCVQKIIGRFKSDGLIENKSGRRSKSILSDVAKRKVLKDIKINPKLNAVKLAAETSRIMGKSVSAETVRNMIRHAGYISRVARKKPFISLQNQKKRLEFAKTHQLKTDNFWKKVIFTDESKFNIFGSDGRRTVWRKPNTALDPKNLRPTIKHGGDSVMLRACSGRPRGTTPADDRYIVLQARRNRRQTAGEIARHTTQATGRPISRFTVARRLHGGGLFARRPVRCVPLTPAHRRRRSLWCREHRNWRDNEWGRVLFTDESRFSLSSDSHRILIWRERGSRNHPSNIIERDRYVGRGVLVWGGIMLGSRTDLHIFDAGSVNGTRYCNEILLPYVRLFRGAMGLQFLFMDDNAPCHRTVAAEQLLESEDIERMDWPARSPDLNPIEHVWDFLGRRLAARTLPPVTIRELRLALQDEWAAMPQQLIDTLILSMGKRCETCLAVREDHIPY
ncbi:transposable element Tcb2 transposase [Trichonephila clavipes]|nr:transposable element Tcb2 transposase [Trichonephila clavipes]